MGLDLRKFAFGQRVVNMWNGLPSNGVTALAVRAFKNQLETHLKRVVLFADKGIRVGCEYFVVTLLHIQH